MQIESKIRRKDGTRVTMDTTNYHFAPLADGAHVALVENEAHQDRFLSITEGFRMYRGAEQAVAAPVVTPGPVITDQTEAVGNTDNAADVLYGSNVHPATFDINGKTYTLVEVIALAHKDSGLDAQEWNELEESTRADLIDEALDKLNTAPADERTDLIEQYKAKFGRAPHPNTSIETLRQKLAEG